MKKLGFGLMRLPLNTPGNAADIDLAATQAMMDRFLRAALMTANLEDLNAENEIETLIKAKGFADCLCFLQSGRADLTVMTSGEPLTAAQVAQIRDVVLNKSTVTAQNITVVEVK